MEHFWMLYSPRIDSYQREMKQRAVISETGVIIVKVKKQIAALVMTGVLAAGGVPAFAAAAPDGHTDAQTTPEAQNGVYAQWQEQWETLKDDWTQVSLSPGADQTQMNFAWYSKTGNVAFRVAADKEMSQSVQQVTVQGTEGPKDKAGTQYYSCKATASNLTPGTYYYQIGDGEPVAFEVQDSSDGFSFIYVGDPQIGSSNELKCTDTEEFYAAQSASVCNDSFNSVSYTHLTLPTICSV